jgi:hypothetical protein
VGAELINLLPINKVWKGEKSSNFLVENLANITFRLHADFM